MKKSISLMIFLVIIFLCVWLGAGIWSLNVIASYFNKSIGTLEGIPIALLLSEITIPIAILIKLLT